MLKKVVISAKSNDKALAFFAELDKRKEAAKAKFIKNRTRFKEMLTKKPVSN